MNSSESDHGDPADIGVAVIGMAGRFPGAADLREYWRNLQGGVESISFFSDEELRPHVSVDLLANPDYVKARGVLADADKFDAGFFGVSPREAEVMDPQHRVLLETAWAAIEDAALDERSLARLVGVYAGMANNTYLPNCVQRRPDLRRALGEFNIMLANEKDFLATRVSHKLNLRGPSVNVYTGCSTSLVAICEAFHSLLSFQCDVALAGGVAISVPQLTGYLPVEGGIQSKDGHCRPFDRYASGTVFSDGVGMVVLKRLEDALEDGDRIEAVIRGAALNNDGADKISFAAPSVQGQAASISLALNQAAVDPGTIGYVEAHGTGTHLGDPIEVEALTRAFREHTDQCGFCVLGSVKSNVGHLLAAAGVAGFVKTVLMLKHAKFPPTLHFAEANPEIEFANTPFRVSSRLEPWNSGVTPRRAGVSSFGIGGTNAHVVLEEASSRSAPRTSRPVHILPLSAKTPAALLKATANLADYLEKESSVELADVAHTLQVGRRQFVCRKAAVSSTRDQAVERLRSFREHEAGHGAAGDCSPEVVFLFPGQGAQFREMGKQLFQSEKVYQSAFERCSELFEAESGWSLVGRLYGGEADNQPDDADALFWQPALFAVEFSLAEMLGAWGIKPSIVLGHSLGELVAATHANIFSLKAALRFLAARNAALKNAPKGGMLSVLLGEAEIASRISGQLSLAAVNSATLSVVAGPEEELAHFESQLSRAGIACRRLASSLPFHSAMLDTLVVDLARDAAGLKPAPPDVRMLSGASGDWLSQAQAADPGFWCGQVARPVYFHRALQKLPPSNSRLVLEVGPGTQLTTFFQQSNRSVSRGFACATLGDRHELECRHLMEALAGVWSRFGLVDWAAFNEGLNRRKLSLPTYPFARERFWADPPPAPLPAAPGMTLAAGETETGVVPAGGRAMGGARPEAVNHALSDDDFLERVEARSRRRQQARSKAGG